MKDENPAENYGFPIGAKDILSEDDILFSSSFFPDMSMPDLWAEVSGRVLEDPGHNHPGCVARSLADIGSQEQSGHQALDGQFQARQIDSEDQEELRTKSNSKKSKFRDPGRHVSYHNPIQTLLGPEPGTKALVRAHCQFYFLFLK